MDYTIRKYIFEIYERTDMTFVGTEEEFAEHVKELCKDKKHEWHLSDIVQPTEYERDVARVRVMDKATGYNNHS